MVGGVVGGVVALLLILGLLWRFMRRRHRRLTSTNIMPVDLTEGDDHVTPYDLKPYDIDTDTAGQATPHRLRLMEPSKVSAWSSPTLATAGQP